LAQGKDVICLDNFFTGAKANIAYLLANPGFELVRHDVTFPLYVEVDEIYNLACPASPVHYQHDPVQTTKPSVRGANIKVARIFNTYGPRMHPNDGRVVSNFIVQALKGEPITLFGDGTQTRSFCYVDDLIDGFLKLMDMPADFTGPVNLGNPGEFTMIELAQKVKAITGSASPLVHKPLPVDDPKQRQPDITLAREALGWQPTVSLDEGLSKTIAYFDKLLAGK
jgi:nucleoside-diphosphate-sugar epimerase